MPNEWERMLISLALRPGWWGAGDQKCLCLFSELIPWQTINHHLLSSHKVTTVDFVFGECQGLGSWTNAQLLGTLPFLRLKLSGWGQANLQIRGQTFAWPEGGSYLQGTPDNVNHKYMWLQKCHLFYLNGINYELGIQKGNRGQAIATLFRKGVSKFLTSIVPSSPYLQNTDNNTTYLSGMLWELIKWYLRAMPYSLAANKKRQARWGNDRHWMNITSKIMSNLIN